MISTDWRSSRRGTEILHPALEERPGIMRPRPGLRVELHRACAELRVVEPFDRAVVEGDVCCLAALARPDGEAVVLARHKDAAGAPVYDGMVGAAVAERKLEGLEPGREREQLVAEADPEHRHPPDQA